MAEQQVTFEGKCFDDNKTGINLDAERLNVTGEITTDTPLLTTAQDIAGAINELFTLDPGGGDWEPPDWWLTVPEPASNEAYYLIDTTNGLGARVHASISWVQEGDVYGSVDWGDGTQEDICQATGDNSHEYAEHQQYLIKVTVTNMNTGTKAEQTEYEYINFSAYSFVTYTYAQVLIVKYGSDFPFYVDFTNRDVNGVDTNMAMLHLGQSMSSPSNIPCYYIQYPLDFTLKKYDYLEQIQNYCVNVGNTDCYVTMDSFAYEGKICKWQLPKHYLGWDRFGMYGISNISSLVLSEDVTLTASTSAFFNNTGLKSITLPGVTSLGSFVFQNCYNLESISAPNCVSVGEGAFYGCTNLKTINFADGCVFTDGCFRDTYMLQR